MQRILLIQCRAPKDPTRLHEQQCIGNKLPDRVEMTAISALESPAKGSWLKGHDAVILGGSGDYSVNDPRSQPWVSPLRHLLDELLHQAVPSFGLCFGHQLLGLHLGGQVLTADDHAEVGTVSLELSDEGGADPLFGVLPKSFVGQTGHSDSVLAVPSELIVAAGNETLKNQAFRVHNLPIVSTQFHPDLSAREAQERYLPVAKSLNLGEAELRKRLALFKTQPNDASTLLLKQFSELY